MKITHYLYNAFVLGHDGAEIATGPGQNLWLCKLKSLIPKSQWPGVTHLVFTYGDPDHHWQSDRVVKAAGAYVTRGHGLTRQIDGRVGIGAMGFKISLGDTPVLNLGDPVLVADDKRFQREVERLGVECTIPNYAEALTVS